MDWRQKPNFSYFTAARFRGRMDQGNKLGSFRPTMIVREDAYKNSTWVRFVQHQVE
jgi:hypothetical protein